MSIRKDLSSNESNKKISTEVKVAIIALIGVLITSIFTNWDKMFHNQVKTPIENKKNIDSLTRVKEKEITIYIISQTYRRAFAMNFKTRFVKYKEYNEVLESIKDSHTAIQSKYVEVVSLNNLKLSNIVYNLLKKLDLMENTFKTMEQFIYDNGEGKDYNPRRLDGSGPLELTKAFDDMESIRLQFIEDIRQLAEQEDIVLPDIPAQISNWGR